MPGFLSKRETISGKLNARVLSLFYAGINRKASIIKSIIYDKKKVIVSSNCLLYRCRIRISDNSKYVRIGEGTRIENNAFLNAHGGSIDIGKNCFIGPNTIIQGYGGVDIGNRVLIAGNVFISSSNHLYENISERDFLLKEEGKKTSIGSNTWIGSNVTIVAGVTIGDRCVIGAGSVVTKNIADNSVAVGVPARVIKTISSF